MTRPLSVLAALYAGLVLTVIAALAPLNDAVSDNLADHIRAGYPHYTPARIDSAVTTYEVILTVIGVVGVLGWIAAIYAVTVGKPWAAGLATGLFVGGLGIALSDLFIRDTSGETGLSPLLGWLGVLPCLPGLASVVALWRLRRTVNEARHPSASAWRATRHGPQA